MEFCGSGRYRLTGKEAAYKTNASFICNHTLPWALKTINGGANTNAGGWDASSLRFFLNKQFYYSLPINWKSLIKKAKIPASAGNKSKEIIISEDYVYIPSIIEMSPNAQSEPYSNEGSFIPWYTENASRLKPSGFIVEEDVNVFSSTVKTDPSADPENYVKKGDIWVGKAVTTSNDYWYNAYASSIYLPQSYCNEYGFSPPFPAAIGGGWFPLINSQFLRSPSLDNNNTFGSVSG